MQVKNLAKRGLVCLFLTLITLVSVGFCADAVLDVVPQGSLFCVKVNNFDAAIGQLDQFTMGLAPMTPSMMLRMQIAGLLGDPTLSGLNTAGNFAVFGLPKEKTEETGEPDLYVVVLLPVKDYQQFVSASPSVGEPDAQGVSKIANKPMVAVKAGSFAMLGKEADSAKLIEIAKAVSSGSNSMAKSIDADMAKLATEMPIWAYGDIEKINEVFGPQIQKAFAEAKTQMQQQSAGMPQMGKMSEMMNVYFGLINDFLGQGKYASVSLKPEPTVLRIHEIIAAKPGTDMAGLLTVDSTLPKTNKLAGLMEDGAAINCAAKVQSKWMEKCGKLSMDFYKSMMAQEEADKWQKIMNDGVAAMGNTLMMTCKADTAAKPPFAVKYVVEIKDKAKYQQVYDESMKLMTEGAMADFYKEMGVDIKFDYKKAASSHNGVAIDSLKYSIEMTDTNSPQAMMIKQMYGEGINYLMALTDNYFIATIGSDKEAAIKGLIDSAKSGQMKAPSGEVSAAMALIEGSAEADFVGSINIVRLMQMGMSFMPMPMPIPFDQIPTTSNIAFAGKVADGKLVADVAIPKQHIQELMTGMQMLMMQQMQQQQQMQTP
ncbi:MAG: hypothetical protein JW804_01305 [Sedimentisphaerales bacterium]|nr:hypothetical protein [Sedimentisphaerales bacterium]